MNEHKQILDLIDEHEAEEIESRDFMWMLLEYPREAVEEVKDLIDIDIYENYLMERWRLFQGYIGLHWPLPITVDKEATPTPCRQKLQTRNFRRRTQ